MLVENSGGGAAVNPENEGRGGSDSGGFEGGGERVGGEEGDRNSAGNRWPREETLALLQVRSDMDVAFRDSTVKAPLWDEVSRYVLSKNKFNRIQFNLIFYFIY